MNMRVIAKLSAGFIVIAVAISVLAGTLDHAPFHIMPAGNTWKLNDSVVQPKGKGVYILASLTNVQSGLTARITKTEFAESPAKNLDQALYVSAALPQTGRVMVKDEDLCVHCGLCAERCPTAAWDMQKFELLLPLAMFTPVPVAT